MEIEPYVSLREGLRLEVDGPRAIVRDEWHDRFGMDGLTAGTAAAIDGLNGIGTPLTELISAVGQDLTALAHLHYYLALMTKARLLRHSLVVAEDTLLHIEQMADGPFAPVAVPADTSFQLSRFACLRREGVRMVVESLLSAKRAVVPGAAPGAILACLAAPHTLVELRDELPPEWRDIAEPVLGYLLGAGIVVETADEDPILAQWEFHDLMFHSRSRLGRHDYPSGAVFPFAGSIEPLPAYENNGSDGLIALPEPDMTELRAKDRPFADVMEARRSLRGVEADPITVNELSEFLFRVARIRKLIVVEDSANPLAYETSSRPYPSGGACYDLEIYLCVNKCAGLGEGYYHYDPLRHGLSLLPDRPEERKQLLGDAVLSAMLSAPPQVLVVITSRFQRIAWKYRSIAYATTLKNVGVLYGMMQLTATAMGLASCPLGNGNAYLGAKAGGSDYFAESSVGEFVLGGSGEGR